MNTSRLLGATMIAGALPSETARTRTPVASLRGPARWRPAARRWTIGSMSDTMQSRSLPHGPARSVLVVYEPGRAGERALARAAELAGEGEAQLTVVVLAPQDTDPARCVVGTPAYNREVRADAARELAGARELLAGRATPAHMKVLVQGSDPPLPVWAAAQGFDVILLARRGGLLRARRGLAASLRSATGARVHRVGT